MRKSMTLGLVALVLAGGLVATASAAGQRGAHGVPGADFESLDRTGDSLLTAEDLAAARDARFAEFDANGDGEVTEEEFVERARGNASERAAAMFARLDADGDGGISRDVLEARTDARSRVMDRMLSRFDTDGDGAIGEAEWDAARAEMREMRPGRGGGRGEGRHR